MTHPHPTPVPSPIGEGWPKAGEGCAASAAPVGVLALQGDFARHAEALARAGLESREVRRPEGLESLSGLILPGGESTTYLKFFDREEGWKESLTRFAESGKPVLATCAGLILLASGVENPSQPSLGVIDVDVIRNAYGRQLESFVGTATANDGRPVEAVFIRAPKISRLGPAVEVLAREGKDPVLVRQHNVYGATFHPELSTGSALHRQIFGA